MVSTAGNILMIPPNERAISPYTGTNWEGVGVRPDIITSYEEALTEALKQAKKL